MKRRTFIQASGALLAGPSAIKEAKRHGNETCAGLYADEPDRNDPDWYPARAAKTVSLAEKISGKVLLARRCVGQPPLWIVYEGGERRFYFGATEPGDDMDIAKRVLKVPTEPITDRREPSLWLPSCTRSAIRLWRAIRV